MRRRLRRLWLLLRDPGAYTALRYAERADLAFTAVRPDRWRAR